MIQIFVDSGANLSPELREQYNIHLTQVNDELRQAQDIAAEALQSAERASKAKTDFLSNMSHDIRTPMNAIIGITTLMKNELHQPEKLAEHLGKLESSGQLLLGIINNILDMSRIESGKTTLNVEKMNLPQQIRQLDSIIRQQAGQRRAHQILQQHTAQRNQSSLFHRYPTPHTVLSSFSGSGTPAARSFARIFLMCCVTAVSSAVPSIPKTAS